MAKTLLFTDSTKKIGVTKKFIFMFLQHYSMGFVLPFFKEKMFHYGKRFLFYPWRIYFILYILNETHIFCDIIQNHTKILNEIHYLKNHLKILIFNNCIFLNLGNTIISVYHNNTTIHYITK